ncbi:MAG: PaaI family thioesterase [Acidimicrobiales bacterium]
MTDFPQFDSHVAARMVAADGSGSGGLPGYLGMKIVDVGPGVLACELEVTTELLNPFGAAHGGVISALVDHVLGAVCMPVVPLGSWPATSEFKLNFTAPARAGTMRAEARIVSLSKRTAIVRVDVTNESRLVGVAQGTVTVMAPR